MEERSLLKRLIHYGIWIGGASVLFLVVYGYCNYFSSLKQPDQLYHLYCNWELTLPLVPWMIIPYRSLDWILIVSFFMLSKNNIKRFGLHMMIALIPAAIIFTLFPGACGFVRPDPEMTGIFSPLFKVLYILDKPHNLFPSLHITYSYVGLKAIADQYSSLKIKLISLFWFIMICLSIIFTYQHHLFDLATGLLLGVLIYRFTFKSLQDSPEIHPNKQI